jgi:hypothetical protein
MALGAAYAVILGTCTAGLLNLSPWAACVGACLLALISMTSNGGAYARYGHVGSGITMPTLVFSSILNAAVTGAAAFGLGRLIAWVC